jgi:hypothetical protein
VLMRGRGMKRSRAEGAKRFAVFVGVAMLANKHDHRGATDEGAAAPPEGHPKPCSRCRAQQSNSVSRMSVRANNGARNARKFSSDRRLRRDVGIPRSTTSTRSFCSRCIRFNFDNALLALSFYRDGCDWTSGKIAMRSPRTEPSQSSLAT